MWSYCTCSCLSCAFMLYCCNCCCSKLTGREGQANRTHTSIQKLTGVRLALLFFLSFLSFLKREEIIDANWSKCMSTPKRQPATATLSERLRVIRIPTKEGEIYCFCSSNHCHALTAVLICHADLSKKKRSFDLSCHFFGWSFCNFEKQFWRELSNNRASYYYWTRWVDMLQVAGLTERTFLPGPKLEWFEHNWCYICWQSFFTCITGARNPFLNTYQKVSFKRCAMMN